jgi:hypothetical protein
MFLEGIKDPTFNSASHIDVDHLKKSFVISQFHNVDRPVVELAATSSLMLSCIVELFWYYVSYSFTVNMHTSFQERKTKRPTACACSTHNVLF